MPKILIVAEHAGGALNPSTARVASAAMALAGAHVAAGAAPAEIELLVLADAANTAPVADAAAALAGVTRVLTVTRPENAQPLAAVLAPQVAAASKARGATALLFPSTTFGKDLAPRVAALIGVDQISDLMAVDGPQKFRRPIYAGNAVASVDATPGALLVATVRTASFAEAGRNAAPPPIETLTLDVALPTHTRFVSRQAEKGERPDLQSAGIVVSGGRALGSAEKFTLIYQLADALGAAVGASRAAVDAGYAPNDLQVGQTGKIIAPKLYFALGISGAIQHLTGIKDAGTIVAINSDPQAPIFEIADYGLVGDLFTVVPELITSLRRA